MKTGRTLMELAEEVERQSKNKLDVIASRGAMVMALDEETNVPELVLTAGSGQVREFGITPHAHTQIGEKLEINKNYYDKMLASAPELLQENVNYWLNKEKSERHMIRTLDGDVRAVLSPSYRPLDNFDLMQSILPSLKDAGCEVVSCEVTPTRLYIKAVTPRVAGEVKRGEVINAGVVISNSEVGKGSLRIDELDFVLACLNGMISARAMRKTHLGKRATQDTMDFDQNPERFSAGTRALSDAALWAQVRDTMVAALNEERFQARLNRMKETAERKVEAPIELVEVVSGVWGLNEREKRGVLTEMVRGGDNSQWGLINAITAMSQKVEDYERATELEMLGGDVLVLPQGEWKTLVERADKMAAKAA